MVLQDLVRFSVLMFLLHIATVQCGGMMKVDPNANLDDDAARLNNAFGLVDTDDSAFLQILPYRGCQQRSEIYQKLDQEKRQNKKEYNYMSGDVCVAVMNCFFCGPDYYAVWFKQALDDRDMQTMIEILVLLSYDDPNTKAKVLSSEVVLDGDDSSAELIRDWANDGSDADTKIDIRKYWELKMEDDIKNWGVEVMMRTRVADTGTDEGAAADDAKALKDEVEDDLGDSRQKLDEILCERPVAQVKLILEEFKRQNDDKSLEEVVNDELGGDLKDAYVNMIMYVQEGRMKYLATKLNEAMSGMGTNEKNLSRLIVYLAESELVEVSAAYQEKFEESLVDRIRAETSGFNRDFLLAFMGESA